MKKKVKRLFFDIETSPCIGFFWRPGWKLNVTHDKIIKENAIICICWKWEGEDKIYSSEWDKGDDKECLKTFLKEALKADELVAHNGDKFDIKWVNARCLIHDLGPLPVWKTVDTCSISRRKFAFNSHRLDYLGQLFFNEGKIKTSFSMWEDIVLHNKKSAMDDMVKYCKKDVDLLERVWDKLQPYQPVKTHAGALKGLDRWTCPHDGSTNVRKHKRTVTASGVERYQMRCKDCGKYFTISKSEYKKYKEWRKAK